MTKLMVSFFDQFPEYNDHKIEIRGKDGYVSIKNISAAINKRFSDWTRTRFAQEVLDELSLQTGLPIERETFAEKGTHPHSAKMRSEQTPLIDRVQGSREGIMVHPAVAFAYSMSEPRFFARISLWLTQMQQTGTVNPHVLEWTREEFERGNRFNRDDIDDLYGHRD